MGTAAAVAILIRKEKEIVAAFRDRRATTPDRGVTLDAAGVHDGVALRRLRDRAVIRDAGAGSYYLDEPVWEANTRMRRRMAALVLILVAAMIGLGFVRFH